MNVQQKLVNWTNNAIFSILYFENTEQLTRYNNIHLIDIIRSSFIECINDYYYMKETDKGYKIYQIDKRLRVFFSNDCISASFNSIVLK